MRATLLSAVLLAGLFGARPLFEPMSVVQACSCPDCDAVRDSDVIVGGRIVGWKRSDIDSPLRPAYTPIEVSLEIDRVFKGAAPDGLTVIDLASLFETGGSVIWSGAGGACGAFDEDPASKYIILGFNAAASYPWQASRPSVIYLGSELSGERYEQALDRLAVLGAPRPPSVGDSPPEDEPPSADWMLLSTIGAGFLLLTLVLVLARPRNG